MFDAIARQKDIINNLKKNRKIMAKQNGLIKVKGSLDGLTFYETKDGHIVRKKNLERSAKVKTDARYERVRENNAEFGAAVKSASYL